MTDGIFGGWNVHVEFSISSMGYDVTFYRDRDNGDREFLQLPTGPCMITAVRQGEYQRDLMPSIRMDEHTAQLLVTALIGKGVKPKEASKIEGILESQTKHLEDMRNILKTQKVMS